MTTLASAHDKLLCAEIDSTPPVVVANRDTPGPWEQFEIETLNYGRVAIKAANGLYLTAENDGTVVARGDRTDAWQQWTVHTRDGRLAFESGNHNAPGHLTAEIDGRVTVRSETRDAWQWWQPSAATKPGAGDVTDRVQRALQGRVRVDGRVWLDDVGPALYTTCHAMELFSAATRRFADVEAQLDAIAPYYPVIRVCDSLGWYDYWQGREVGSVAYTAREGYRVEVTSDYFGYVVRFLQACQARGLKVFWSRGDLQMYGGITGIENHVRAVCRTIREHGLQDVIECMEVVNEPRFNGFSQHRPEDARRVAAVIRQELPGTLVCHGENSEEPEDAKAWMRGADVASIHGHRPGQYHDVLRHIFSSRREALGSSIAGKQGEPFGPGDDVSGTRHHGPELGRSDDVEFLCMAAAVSFISQQQWTYMSGYGVRWKGPIHEQPGFKEVAAVSTVFDPGMFGWHLTRGGLAENPWKSASGYHGDAGVTYGPHRVDSAVAGDGRYATAVYAGVAPYVIAAQFPVTYKVIHPATLQVEQEGAVNVGETLRLEYRIGRIIVGQRA